MADGGVRDDEASEESVFDLRKFLID